MSTGTRNDPCLQTFIVRIYRQRGAAQSAPFAGTVETVPGGKLHAFDSMQKLNSMLAAPEKTAPRNNRLALHPAGKRRGI